MRTNSLRIIREVLALAAEIAESEGVSHAVAFRRAKVQYRELQQVGPETTYRVRRLVLPGVVGDGRSNVRGGR